MNYQRTILVKQQPYIQYLFPLQLSEEMSNCHYSILKIFSNILTISTKDIYEKSDTVMNRQAYMILKNKKLSVFCGT